MDILCNPTYRYPVFMVVVYFVFGYLLKQRSRNDRLMAALAATAIVFVVECTRERKMVAEGMTSEPAVEEADSAEVAEAEPVYEMAPPSVEESAVSGVAEYPEAEGVPIEESTPSFSVRVPNQHNPMATVRSNGLPTMPMSGESMLPGYDADSTYFLDGAEVDGQEVDVVAQIHASRTYDLSQQQNTTPHMNQHFGGAKTGPLHPARVHA